MGAFTALPLGRRPIRSRILVLYRMPPRILEPILPRGLHPRLLSGLAIASACYTRLGAPRLLRGRAADSEHLAYRFAVQREEKEGWRDSTWIARRETSSWLEARCGAKLLRGVYGRAAFQVQEDVFSVELSVRGERGEEFYLRGEAAGAVANSLFPSAQSLQEFLGDEGPVKPYDVFAPEADTLDAEQNFAPEPLTVFEARSAYFSDAERFPSGAVELDSAWRLVSRRLAVVPERTLFRPRLEPGASSPALPSV